MWSISVCEPFVCVDVGVAEVVVMRMREVELEVGGSSMAVVAVVDVIITATAR